MYDYLDGLSEEPAPDPIANSRLLFGAFTASLTVDGSAQSASILCVHALIAAAADSRTTAASAESLDIAYLYISAVSTLLDSVIDHRRDVREANHSFIDYYEDEDEMVDRIGTVVARAASEGSRISNGGHHRMTAAGVASYYMSAPQTRTLPERAVKARVVRELRPLILPVLAIFRLWRIGKARGA